MDSGMRRNDDHFSTPASEGRAAERLGFRNLGKRDKGVVGIGRDLSLQFLICSLHSRR